MLRLSLSILALALLCVSVQSQSVIRVCYKGNMCDESLCDYTDLQDAVDASTTGDIIEVYEGNYAGALVGCGEVNQAITIRGICATCPGDVLAARSGLFARKHKSMKDASKKVKPTKPTKAPKKKKSMTAYHPPAENGDTCDIFISKDGKDVNTIANERFGFLAGIVFCGNASGSTVENLKFICSPTVPKFPDPVELGIGVYALNADQLTVTRNEFTNCLKGVVLDGTQYAVVSKNRIDSRAVVQTTPTQAPASTPPPDYVLNQLVEQYSSRYFSCNMVMLVERQSNAVSTSQAAYNVIERNQGSLTSVPNAGCTAFLIPTLESPTHNYLVQYNFIRRNQVLGKGAAISGNSSLVGVYTTGNAQNNIIERNQFASLTNDVVMNTVSKPATYYYYNIRHFGQTVRHNRFIQTVGGASVILGDYGHTVIENEIIMTQTTAYGIQILQIAGNQFVDSNKISVPHTPAACDVQDGGFLSSHIENSGAIC